MCVTQVSQTARRMTRFTLHENVPRCQIDKVEVCSVQLQPIKLIFTPTSHNKPSHYYGNQEWRKGRK